jgi:hypothetical protein
MLVFKVYSLKSIKNNKFYHNLHASSKMGFYTNIWQTFISKISSSFCMARVLSTKKLIHGKNFFQKNIMDSFRDLLRN